MALIFEYKPGMSLTDPWPFTVTRTLAGYYVAKDGTLKQAAANVLRDSHYPYGVRSTLFEPTAINSCLQSQTLDNATWGPTRSTVTANVTAAPDGTTTADKLVEDTSVTLSHFLKSGTITITAAEFLAASCFFKAGERTKIALRVFDGPVTNIFSAKFDLVAGTMIATDVTGTGVVNGTFIVPLANGWYWCGVWGTLGGANTTANVYVYLLDAGGNFTYTGDGASGSYAWGAQLERNGTAFTQAPTSYLPTTTTVSSARGSDVAKTPWPFKMMPMWCYTSWYDLGQCQRTPSAFAVTLTSSTPANPMWVAMFPGSNADVRSSWISDAGPGGVGAQNRNTTALTTVNPTYGQFVETFARVLKDGSTLMAARINGGAIVTSGAGPQGTVPFCDLAAPTFLILGQAGTTTAPLFGVTGIKIGADPTYITTLDQALKA